ncbi:MAG: hypothetical protein FJ293_02840 [Planctomycetes bacterium]|nr:hypothetical protein [Planctomycetota bacterium]
MLSIVAWWCLAVAGEPAGAPGAPGAPDAVALAALAERCGSQIDWLRDRPPVAEAGEAFQYLRAGKRFDAAALDRDELPDDALRRLIGEACSRARAEGRLVLWHVWRLEGGQMYRAPLLDDYMDQVLWSDPELVALVRERFVPLRTRLSRALGTEFGVVAWEQVEPALLFLDADGKVVHRITHLRTFDPRWCAEVCRRVLALRPELPSAEARPPAADAFATPDAARLERTRTAYHAALAQWQAGRDDAALAAWRALAETEPDSPFAWRAAANLVPTPDQTAAGAARHAFERIGECWLPAEGLPHDTRWRRTPADAEDAAERAVAWLLSTQRGDGSWSDCRYAYWGSPTITANAWMAITALAATALLEWRDFDPVGIDAAVARAEGYLFGPGGGRLNAGANEECYAHAYRLLYLDRALAQTEDADQRSALCARMEPLVVALTASQRMSGQWAHEYDNAFATAVVLDALRRARAAGVAIPEPAFARGLDGLAAARFADGTFTYGGASAHGAPSPHADHAKDSSGRMPLCEGELHAGGRSDPRRLAHALATYQQHFDRFAKVANCDFHTDGELGGFFFFHDVYHASVAIGLLPEAGRPPHARWLLGKLMTLPEIDGSFLDDHEIGKSCSTASLLALKNVLRDGERR